MAKLFQSLSTRVKVFLAVFLFGLAISFASSFTNYIVRVNQAQANVNEVITSKLAQSEGMLKKEIGDLKNTLSLTARFISEKNNQGANLLSGEVLKQYQKEMIIFAEMLQSITQFRYIDENGQEIIRVERPNKGDTVELVSEDRLQNKAHRYYFKETMALDEGEVWISELDLNIEFQLIEVPYKPVIRVATPVYKNGEKHGIVIINYFADYFLHGFKSLDVVDVFISDSRGNYILHPDKSKQFAKNRKVNANIFTDFPFLKDQKEKSSVYKSEHAIGKIISLNNDRYFYALYKINTSYLNKIHLQQFIISIIFYIFSAIFAFMFSFWFSRYCADIYDKRVKEIASLKNATKDMKETIGELSGTVYTDPLTGAYNRRYFDEKVDLFLKTDVGFGIIMVDLDNFKEINDTFGHVIGDKVLTDFTKIVLENIRDTDFLTRWGGDEFCLIIFDLNKKVLLSIAEKLRRLTAEHDFELNTKVTCSAGISIRKNGEDAQQAFKRADEALYSAKENGRNIVILKDS